MNQLRITNYELRIVKRLSGIELSSPLINGLRGLLIALFFITPSYAQLEVGGFVDSYHAVRIKKPNDFLSSRNRLRLEAYMEFDETYLFVSFNVMHNYILPEQTGTELREAWFDYASDNWDLRIGRQIIIWGKADGIQITDIISPMDLTEFLARDYDDIRMPVDAFKFRYLPEKINFELIWVPNFQGAVLPSGDNPWAVGTEFPADLNVNQIRIDDDSLSVRFEHHRLTFVGLEFSMPYHEFVIRGEAAYYKGKYLEPASFDDRLMQKNTINWLLGLDWSPGGNWSLSAQFADNFILNYDKKILNEEHAMISTLNISKKLFRETLTISSMGYLGINDKDCFIRSSMDYALTDELHLLAGFDIFIGDKGMFGQFKDNNEVWVKAKYSF
jgi:hypothetical protein